MKLSVIVPVYNKAPFIEECFASIFSQSFDDFELIIVDDKSTDNSLEVLRSLDDQRMRIVPLDRNLGPAGAAQRAMDLARGEFIIRVDADDINLPGRFARQIAFMEKRPELGASGGHLELIGAESGIWKYPIGIEACRAELLFSLPVSQGASILRTEVLRRNDIRFKDDWPRIGEDWLLWVELSRYSEFDNLDEPVIQYRRGVQNSAHGVDQASYRESIYRQVFDMLQVPLTPRQAELHLLTIHTFKSDPDEQIIVEYRHWLEHLKKWNLEHGRFPEAAFAKRVERAWEHVFHFLPPYGWSPAWAHYRSSPVQDRRKLMYMLKYRLAKTFGRLP